MKLTVMGSPERLDDWTRFAAELSRHAGEPVPVEAVALCPAPPDGFILIEARGGLEPALAACAPPARPALTARLVLLDVFRGDIPDVLARYRPAALVDQHSLFDWETGGWKAPGAGYVQGYQALAPRLGAECSGIYAYDPYRPLRSKHHESLPHLLADYLRAYEAAPELWAAR